jgi:DNA-binding XRE family transcriptional regulator
MVRRRSTPGSSPVAMLLRGSNWLDKNPSFDTRGDQTLADVLAELHRSCRLLARRRAELKLSQTQVAQWAGVTAQTVAAIEDGATWPDHLTLLKIATVLGGTVETRILAGKAVGPRTPSSLLSGR